MAKTIITKRCSHCKQIKPISEFYKDKSQSKGYGFLCKPCALKKSKIYQQTKQGKATKKRYDQSEKGKTKRKIYQQTAKFKTYQRQYRQSKRGRAVRKRYALAYPKYEKAKSAVQTAIRKGILPKVTTLKCSCGEQAVHYHHHKGYAKEHQLDVIPVCKKCHSLAHIKQETL